MMSNSNPITDTQNDRILVATLNKPYGIKGWLWVYSKTEARSDIFAMPLLMKTATGFLPLTVTEWRAQGKGLVAKFAEVPDRNAAEGMHGTTVWTTKEALPNLPPDEYYWADLVGLTVINAQNECLGQIKNLFETGANDVMTVVSTADSIDGETRLIPWHGSVVLAVDLSANTMRVAWEKDY